MRKSQWLPAITRASQATIDGLRDSRWTTGKAGDSFMISGALIGDCPRFS